MAQLHNAFRPRQVPKWMCAMVAQPRVVGQMVEHHRFGRTRQQRLAAVAQIAEPRRPVDRRPDVVALVAQLDLARVHTYPQPDRRKRGALQRQRARDGVTGARERDDEVCQRGIQPGDGGGHLVGLGLPQPGGALDVGEKQRHRASRCPLARAGSSRLHTRR
jgi:hypothetical protein